tara:strand:- start:2824 stop:3537 length:714 start_codon:yes stop_codon:yes gene_type:complete
VPVGYAVATPVAWFSGDQITFYVRIEGDMARLEDSGTLLLELESQGLDLTSESRREALSDIMGAHCVTLDEEDCLFLSEWVPVDNVASLVPEFLAFLTRSQDLTLLSRDRVRSTFREDLAEALQEGFGDSATITFSEPLIADLPQYRVDIVVRHKNGKIAAVFPATSDATVLRAVLFSVEMERHNITGIVPFLVYESMKQGAVTNQSREIATNADLEFGVWSGGSDAVVGKVQRYLQ